MRILSAMDIKNGAKAEVKRLGSMTQPTQFLPEKEKDDQWRCDNMDWFEWQGLIQLRRKAKRFLKNYKLAKGEIDRSDYIVDPENNEFSEMIDKIVVNEDSAMELKFYPIIPTVVNILANEFNKRNSKIMFRAVDDISENEMFEAKKAEIEEVLIYQAEQKLMEQMYMQGIDPASEQGQQMMSPESIKSLPEIENFYRKSYRNIYEEWAAHQMNVDVERFKMKELEDRAFRDMLCTDSEFWHFRMMENDYEVELWNPPQVFYSKSPGSRYISESNWVGMTDLMTVSDVIDKYGWMMDKEELESLEAIYPVKSAGYIIPGYQNDGAYYDATKSHEWNTEMPSLQYRQFMSLYDNARINGDVFEWILEDNEDLKDWGRTYLLRVSTVYWKTQRKLYHLTKVLESGEVVSDIVGEDYKVTEKPIYNTTLYKEKCKETLVYGEHLDCLWINEVWGGVKIGPNRPSYWGNNYSGGINPIYLGINGGKPGRIPFQFKGDLTLYGCKPPVEGCVFSDRNGRTISMVEQMKPFQIGFNLVNNQISDILVDEMGTVILLDQNALPRKSLGEDWGTNPYESAYIAMKNFNILPLDTSITNTENAVPFQHYQPLNLEQTNRLMSRIQLANYFRTEAMNTIGITPERIGQQMSRQTAEGVEQSINASYAQTEQYFINHCDNLMPRVHQMRTELAQYYNSNNPSVRLRYITSEEEKINFQINGTKLLGRDLNIFASTKVNSRHIMEQMKQLALNNNTMGASIYDLGNVLKSDSIAELTNALKASEDKIRKQQEQEQQFQQQLEQQRMEAEQAQQDKELAYQREKDQLDRQKDILVAEIRAASTGGLEDINQNQQSDYEDSMARIQKSQEYRDTMNFKREQEANKLKQNSDKMELDREDMQTRRDIAQKQLEIARENKNKYDSKSKSKK